MVFHSCVMRLFNTASKPETTSSHLLLIWKPRASEFSQQGKVAMIRRNVTEPMYSKWFGRRPGRRRLGLDSSRREVREPAPEKESPKKHNDSGEIRTINKFWEQVCLSLVFLCIQPPNSGYSNSWWCFRGVGDVAMTPSMHFTVVRDRVPYNQIIFGSRPWDSIKERQIISSRPWLALKLIYSVIAPVSSFCVQIC